MAWTPGIRKETEGKRGEGQELNTLRGLESNSLDQEGKRGSDRSLGSGRVSDTCI